MARRSFPNDKNGVPILAGYAAAGTAYKETAGAASARIGPFGAECKAIEIFAKGDIHYQTGGDDIEASAASHFLAAGERVPRSLLPYTDAAEEDRFLAIIRAGDEDAEVFVSEII